MFKKRATESLAVLSSAFSGLDLESKLNPGPDKPKRGSFEITLVLKNGEKVLVWSGLKKGPPRKEKFPDPNVLVKNVKDKLK